MGEGKVLAKMFGVSCEYVSRCLCGHKNTELSQKIRNAAVNRGGDPIYEK